MNSGPDCLTRRAQLLEDLPAAFRTFLYSSSQRAESLGLMLGILYKGFWAANFQAKLKDLVSSPP